MFRENKKTLKHWLITELGTARTERIHLHGIVESKNIKDIEEKWSYGYVKCGTYVNEKTIAYITKYMLKTDIKHKTYKPVILASKGIGKAYINTAAAQARKFNGEKTKDYYMTKSGHKLALPIYYRNKLWTDEEREKLWIQKLDEEKMYILGQEYDLKDKKWLKGLKEAQKYNDRLGYGTSRKNWTAEQYEKERREMIQKNRNV